jgi:hypothetical protein
LIPRWRSNVLLIWIKNSQFEICTSHCDGKRLAALDGCLLVLTHFHVWNFWTGCLFFYHPSTILIGWRWRLSKWRNFDKPPGGIAREFQNVF